MASVYKQKNRQGKEFKVWRFKYRGMDGKWKYGVGWTDKNTTLEHAQNLEAECRSLRKGEKESPPSWLRYRNTPILEIITSYLEWGRTCGGRNGRPWDVMNGRVKETYLKFWKEVLDLRVMGDITLVGVEARVKELLQKEKPKTAALKVEALRCLCNWALKRGIVRDNPLLGMSRLDTRPKLPHRALTEEEVTALLKSAPAHRRLWYETALETGFRVAELRALKIKNFDQSGPSLNLGADFTKNRKDARQPITCALANKLTALAVGRNQEDPLLCIPVDTHDYIGPDLKSAGIQIETAEGKATWHSLRKVYVNNLVRSGADVKTVMELARHCSASLSMEVYASAQPALLRAAVEKAARRIQDSLETPACCTGVAQTSKGADEKLASTVAAEGSGEFVEVAPPGFEPRYPESESGVLPLDDRAVVVLDFADTEVGTSICFVRPKVNTRWNGKYQV